MHYFIVLFLAPVAHVASGQHTDDDPSYSDTPIRFSNVSPFEPWPGYFKGEPNPGNQQATDFCSNLRPDYENEGWLVNQAYCYRQDQAKTSFKVDCAAKAQILHTSRDHRLQCGSGQMCTEFHDKTQAGQDAWDVVCAPWVYFRQFPAKNGLTICSSNYRNDRQDNKAVNISLQTNVLDSQKVNRIAPENIFYRVDGGPPVGVSRKFDPVVESGIFTVPHGAEAQSCITPADSSDVFVFVNLVGLTVLD